jgi:hypothetical protein
MTDHNIKRRGPVEWITIPIPMRAEIQQESDGSWVGMVRRLSSRMVEAPTKEELVRALQDLYRPK